MSILDKIIENKQIEVNRTLSSISDFHVHKNVEDKRIPLDFKNSLKCDTMAIIAEVKKASPSKGLIRENFDPLEIAVSYQQNRANCISILTEKAYFQGSPLFLEQIRRRVNIPLLRKDFIVDRRQIRESYDLGADAVLLIAAVLSRSQLKEFQALAEEFGLTSLVEVHDDRELDLVLDLGFDLIGINNRDLKTFVTDINRSVELRDRIPDRIVTVSESGIKTREDCMVLRRAGFDAVLVGETLMRSDDPGKAINELVGNVK